MRSDRSTRSRAFTLVELLVVIGIIAVLIAILLPVLVGARRSANDVKCRTNMRELSAALLNYAAENKGRFPPFINMLAPLPPPPQRWWNWWSDYDRIGRYLKNAQVMGNGGLQPGSVIYGVMVCPADDGASRSYAMNFWASCAINIQREGEPARIGIPSWPNAGVHWSTDTKGASKLILLVEQFSGFSDGAGAHVAYPISGATSQLGPWTWRAGHQFVTVPLGLRFVGPGVRFHQTDGPIDWGRHRQRGDGGSYRTQAKGRSNFAFADGHVESFTVDQIVDSTMRKSRLVAWWTPIDHLRS